MAQVSSIARPNGQLPPGVYWRRRILVLVVIALLIFGLTRIFGGGGGDSDATPGAGGTSATSPPPSTAPSTVPTTQAPKQRKRKEVEVGVTVPITSAPCDVAKVGVSPAVGPRTYAGGAVPLRLRFSTTATTACTLRVKSPDLLVAVADDSGTVWDSRTCSPIGTRTIDLQPTWTTMIDVQWDGRKSSTDCARPSGFVPVGSYVVKAAMLGGQPDSKPFALAQRPAPRPVPTPTTVPTSTNKPKSTAKPKSRPTVKPRKSTKR